LVLVALLVIAAGVFVYFDYSSEEELTFKLGEFLEITGSGVGAIFLVVAAGVYCFILHVVWDRSPTSEAPDKT